VAATPLDSERQLLGFSRLLTFEEGCADCRRFASTTTQRQSARRVTSSAG